jgi:16S rRNA (cytosine967-C5)-methyltransferase
MHTTQQIAARVVSLVLNGRNLTQTLSTALQAAPGLTPQQRGAIQDLSYGTLRFNGQLVRILGKLLYKPVQDESLRCLLLVALYQLQYSKAAPHAIVDFAVRAVRKQNAAAGGLANAVLRNFLRQREELLTFANQSEEGKYSHPQWWINLLKQQYGAQAKEILLAGNQHPPMTLRVNCLQTTPFDYISLLENQGIQATLVYNHAVLLLQPVTVDKLPGFSTGMVSVQDAGAQYAARLLDVGDGMRVLDACAAPGSKSTHLLELAKIDLLALDKDPQRLLRVEENMQRLNLSAGLLCGDAAQPEDWWGGQLFHRILADVPCSASGVVRRHPDIKWLRRPQDIGGFAQQQLQILNALWRLLENQGKLLYVTCSIFEQENQQVINEFLRQHEDAAQQPISAPDMINGQLLPTQHHDGFFYALIQKLNSDGR